MSGSICNKSGYRQVVTCRYADCLFGTRCDMNVSVEAADIIGPIFWPEKVASKMCWFSSIYISVASGSSLNL
jgi:hypothetical protein